MRFTSTILIVALTVLCAPASEAAVLEIKALSSRPERVSGGDVLLRITQSDDSAVPVTLNGGDVTRDFKPGLTPHTREGLMRGLKLGENIIAAGGKTLLLRNYPVTGPIVSGPHEKPFICTTANFPIYGGVIGMMMPDSRVFGPSLDADCSAAIKITYLYLPRGGKALKPLVDPATLPADMSTTTTTTGVTMNFIVRVETSTIDRGVYQSTVLYDPRSDSAMNWRRPPMGWNRRLVTIEGAGCPGGWYFQGMAGGSIDLNGFDASLFSLARLGEGDALIGNTLQNPSQSCNAVLAGEAAAMSREHFIKTIGVPDMTVSIGCSGGSYGSSQLADAMPGFFDGVLIACTFPDPLSIAFSGLDGHLLTHFFDKTAPGKFTEAQQVAISGYKGMKAFVDAANQAQRTDPVPNRADIPGYGSAVWSPTVAVELRYDPKTNPRGARPTVFDVSRNIYGVDPATGFARRPFDNVGVQYGLKALNAGQISPPQFLDLNEGIGGCDQDANYVANRVTGDTGAIKRAYQSGLQLGGNGGLASIPVLDVTGIYNDDSGYHYQWFHFAMRERMAEANGNTDNHVMWRGNPVPFERAWALLMGWVEAVHKDTSTRTARQKVIADKPADVADGCWTSATDFVREPQTFSRENTTPCNATFPSYAFPRYVAGGPLAANIMKCQLKPADEKDYAPSFTPDEFARLKRIFPDGVCDWTRRGVAQTGVVPWASFGPAPENLVFDVSK